MGKIKSLRTKENAKAITSNEKKYTFFTASALRLIQSLRTNICLIFCLFVVHLSPLKICLGLCKLQACLPACLLCIVGVLAVGGSHCLVMTAP